MHTMTNITNQAKSSNKLNPCGFLRSTEGVQEVRLYDFKSPPRALVVNSSKSVIQELLAVSQETITSLVP